MINVNIYDRIKLKDVMELINTDSISRVIIRVNQKDRPVGVLKVFDVCELPIVAERFPKMEVREILFKRWMGDPSILLDCVGDVKEFDRWERGKSSVESRKD